MLVDPGESIDVGELMTDIVCALLGLLGSWLVSVLETVEGGRWG